MTKWDDRFMRLAHEVASWSKDPGTKVGAVLVRDRRIIATGYNGFPHSIDDGLERYANRELKLAFTVHAEVNALLNAAKNGAKTEGSTLYVTFPPCVSCSSSVIQAGVTSIVRPPVESAPERWLDNFRMGDSLLAEAGIEVTPYFSEQ